MKNDFSFLETEFDKPGTKTFDVTDLMKEKEKEWLIKICCRFNVWPEKSLDDLKKADMDINKTSRSNFCFFLDI